MKDETIKLLEMIVRDMEKDAKEFDGKPFNGKTVAEYFGNHGAAIAALANIIKLELKQVCKWTLANIGSGDYYETNCKHNGTEAEEDLYNYCPYCGRKIMSK